MNQKERESIERFRRIQDNNFNLRSIEIRRLLEELTSENNPEKIRKITRTIRYHQYEQQQYLIWLKEHVEQRFLGLIPRTYNPNGRIIRYKPE